MAFEFKLLLTFMALLCCRRKPYCGGLIGSFPALKSRKNTKHCLRGLLKRNEAFAGSTRSIRTFIASLIYLLKLLRSGTLSYVIEVPFSSQDYL